MKGADGVGRRPPGYVAPGADDHAAPATPPSLRPLDPSRTPLDALRSEVHLACVAGPDLGSVIPLTEPVVLGRQGDVPLSAASASRRHAQVSPLQPQRARGRHRQGGQRGGRRAWGRRGRGRRPSVARVEDLASANGTTVEHPGALRRGRAVPPGSLATGSAGTRATATGSTGTGATATGSSATGSAGTGSSGTGSSGTGSSGTGSTATGSGRSFPSRRERLHVGSRLRIGEDVFEVRGRPESLAWPEPPARRRLSPMALAPVMMLVGFLLWRLWAMGGAHMAVVLAGPALALVVVALGVRRSRRSRRWARWDAAHLALVLASMEATGPRTPGADVRAAAHLLAPQRSGPGVGWLWPGRTGTRGALSADLVPGDGVGGGVWSGVGGGVWSGGGDGVGSVFGSAAPGDRGTPVGGAVGGWGNDPLRAGTTPRGAVGAGSGDGVGGDASPGPVRRIGLVGPRAVEAALWWCAQVAARTGGAVVWLPPTRSLGRSGRAGSGQDLTDDRTEELQGATDARSGVLQDVFVLGDGSTPIHVVDSDHCPHCEPNGEADPRKWTPARAVERHRGGDRTPDRRSGGDRTPDRRSGRLRPPGQHSNGEHCNEAHGPGEHSAGKRAAVEDTGVPASTRPAPPTRNGTVPHPPGGPRVAPPAVLHVGIAEGYRGLPPWCDRVVEDPDPPVSPLWWRQVAHPVPADPGADGNQDGLPSCVLLAELTAVYLDSPVAAPSGGDRGALSAPTGTAPAGHGPPGLPALIGIGEGGPVTLDLVRDGPHALLAGTTGSGKSEALATWLLSLAGHHSPDRLRLVLIDYKGGAALRPFAALPHTEEVLTDLDPSATDRALTGLGALLVRRERELAEVGVPDLARWEEAHAQGRAPAPPPRVLVVVDEFRILADSHPATLEALVRLAAQGRSLGLHLIAATQRPAGALTPAMRANIEIRLALRCAEETDSLDVLGSATAARLPRLPGRAVLRGGGVLQVAWVPDIDREVAELSHRWPPAGSGRLWPPDLPERCTWSAIPAADRSASVPTPALPLALADRITGTSHGPLLWRSGGIGVEGPAHRTAELETIALALGTRIATGRALPLHVCSHAPTRPAGCATWIRPDDPGPVAMLLEGVLRHGPAVLVATDVRSMVEGIDRCLGPGQGKAWWGRVLAGADRAGVVLVVARPSDVAGAAAGGPSHLPHRLLHVGSSEEALRSGLPASAPTSLLPGRVLAQGFDEGGPGHLRCQVPLEKYPPASAPHAHAPTPIPTPAHAPTPIPTAAPTPTPAGAASPWCVRGAPDDDEVLPEWALGWAGPEMVPLVVPAELDWVVVAADPGPALVRLAALRARPDEPASPPPGAGHGQQSTAPATASDDSPAPGAARLPKTKARPPAPSHPPAAHAPGNGTGTSTSASTSTSTGQGHGTGHGTGHGVTVVHPDQWPTLRTLGSRPLIALDPGEEVLRMLAATLRGVPPSLRAMEWDPHSGVVAHAGTLTRLVLPTC